MVVSVILVEKQVYTNVKVRIHIVVMLATSNNTSSNHDLRSRQPFAKARHVRVVLRV